MIIADTPSKPIAITDILPLLNGIANQKQEHFVVLTFDSGNRLISRRLVFLGTATGVLVSPREVFAIAVADLATAIVVAHNHASGGPRPSADDKRTTKRLIECGEILGISIVDHVIVATNGNYYQDQWHGLPTLLYQPRRKD